MSDGDGTSDLASDPVLLANLMDGLHYFVYFKDRESRFVRINRAMTRRLGLENPEEALGRTDFDFFDREHAQESLADEKRIIATGESLRDKEELEVGPDGERRWALSTKLPLRDAGGDIVGTFGYSRDITDRKLSEQALIESEKLYHTLVENLPLNVFRKDREGRFTFCNRRLCESLGEPLKAILGRTDHDFFPSELSDKYRADDEKIMATGEVFEDVEEYLDAYGSRRYIHVMKSAVRDHEGGVTGIQGVFLDITSEKEAERALRQNEQRYRALMETSRVAIVTATEDDRIFDANPDAESMFGYSMDELKGARLTRLMPERYRERHRAAFRRFIETGRPGIGGSTVEIVGQRRDGEEFPLELSIASWRSPDERVWFAGIMRDMTERAKADQAIRDSEALYHSLVENIPLNVLRKDLDGRITFGTRKFFEFTDMAPSATIGKTDHDLYPEGLAEQYRADDRQVIETGEVLERVEAHHTPNGKTMYVEVFKTPIRDAEGVIVGVQILFWDVTERKEAEETLKQARADLEQRVQQRTNLLTRANEALREGNDELARANAELQDFAYIASHDLQEPLRKIQSFSQRIKDKFSDAIPEQGRDYLDRLHNAASRMSGLISDLLELSRVTTKAKPFARVDLGAIASEVVGDLEARLEATGGRVEIGELPALEGDRTQLRQLFQNLIGNALKFHRKEAPPEVKIDSETDAIEGICRISVADNGIGFDEKYASRIFAVFQRLHGKSAYEGTGIGLAICRKVVERHRGEIVARSADGEGATFVITLPLSQEDPGEPTGP